MNTPHDPRPDHNSSSTDDPSTASRVTVSPFTVNSRDRTWSPTSSRSPGGGQLRLAGLGNRLAARPLESLINAVAVILLGVLMPMIGVAMFAPASADAAAMAGTAGFIVGVFAYALLVLPITVLYEVSMIATRGATLGKQVLGVRVVQEGTGQLPGWGPAFARWAVPYGCSIIPCIGWIMGLLCWLSPTFDSVRRQGWHDKMAKTLVITRR
ncbi:putative RDD family membrane protein YckC [Saccharopolyspora lacisalsi]|uniref:Putative RDD family membrane protein YckC n=1 Tax=Halosaccharopolyspora lacisalsi TaxID=1000566 RepID=A0A839DX55_9PSEU|nr:RDD family protein [Halosaccharopolyspora lacisalsi]MBA8825460.1 putative RDD family membrane protein YckC [Halosaccharopolyspora lacisalsi]